MLAAMTAAPLRGFLVLMVVPKLGVLFTSSFCFHEQAETAKYPSVVGIFL